MNKILEKAKKHILLSTIILVIVFLGVCYINNLFGVMFRQWVYLSIILIAMIGSIAGIIQIIKRRNKYIKVFFIMIIICILIFVIAFGPIILLVLAFLYSPEHIIEKDDKKYVAYVESFLNVDVYYYDYINFLLVGNKVKIHESYGNGGYDPFDGKHPNSKVKFYYYYDDNGKIIDTNEKMYIKKEDEDSIEYDNKTLLEEKVDNNTGESNILYQKEFSNDTIIKIENKGSWSGKNIIQILKSTDGGENWKSQLGTSDGTMDVHYNAKFIFIDENIGFINDIENSSNDEENVSLLITSDGGKNFEKIKIESTNISEEILCEELPYLEDGKLKLKVYSLNESLDRVYYEFISKDDGHSWKYNKEL